MRRFRVAWLVLAVACGGGGTTETAPTPVLTTLTVSVVPQAIEVGQTATATVTGADQNGQSIAVGPVDWTSSNIARATVSSAGTVTGVSGGTATITATHGTLSASAGISVANPPPVLTSLSLTVGSVMVGRSTQAQVAARDQFGVPMAVPALVWSTDSPAIATVGGSGVVTGVSAGATTLRATAGAVVGSASLTVLPFNFGTGLHLVPSEVPPGVYRSNNPPSASCYWERLRNFSGTVGGIIANDLGGGPAVVEIVAGDVGFNSSGCVGWFAATSAVTTSVTAPFTDGTFVVGVDVAPGTWRANTTGTSCYWARLSGFRGNQIIANDLGTAQPAVTIAATDVGFHSSGCGTWSKLN